MRFSRTLPPAAAPIFFSDISSGVKGLFRGRAEVERLIAEIEDFFQVKHCFLLSSGTAALSVLLSALHEIEPDRDEVVVPAYTCYTVPAAVVRAGLQVRPCDVDPRTLDYDMDGLHHLLGDGGADRVLAVLAVHLFGQSADLQQLQEVVPESVSLIEDAAQAMAASGENGLLGVSGRAGFFSLGRGKAITTLHGGVLVTDDDSLAEVLDKLVSRLPDPGSATRARQAATAFAFSLLQHPRLFWIPKSLPFLRLGDTIYDPAFPTQGFSPFQAGLARGWESRLRSFQQARKQNTAWWDRRLNREGLQKVGRRKDSSDVPALLRYPVLAEDGGVRDGIVARSEERGLGIMPVYPDTLDRVEGLAIVGGEGGFPGGQVCAERLFTLPVHPWVRQGDREAILGLLRAEADA